MVDHHYLHVFEYLFLPCFTIIFTSVMKFLAQKNRRKSIWHYFNIGLDLLIMTCFGLMIHGISLYSHLNNSRSFGFFVICTVVFIILLIFTVLVVALIREYGENSRKGIVISNAAGLACLIILIIYIEKGSALYDASDSEQKKPAQVSAVSQKIIL